MKTKSIQKSIPDGWQQVKLGDCLVIKHGKPQKKIEEVNGRYPILATGGVIGWTNTPLYSKPSVLIGRKGTIDKPRYMDTPFWTVDTLFYSQIKENSVPKYLFYKYNTINWYDYNEASGVPSLSATTISSIKFNLPSLSEQKRIVGVLETWDQAIQKLTEKIKKKRNIKKGLMQELLTGKTRLPGFTETWKHTSFGEVCKFWNGFPFPSEYFSEENGVRIIRNRDLKGDNQILYYVGKGISDSYSVYDGDILIGMDGDFMACKWSKGNALLNQRVGKLVAFKNANKDYLFYKIQTPLKVIEQETSSTTVKHLSSKVFENFKVVLPPKLEQDAIADILTTTDKEIQTLECKLKVLQEQKRYLLNNLITGTIRTPETLKTKN